MAFLKKHKVTIGNGYGEANSQRMIKRGRRIKAALKRKMPWAKKRRLRAELEQIYEAAVKRKTEAERFLESLREDD
jgi:hypothetical protein